ncbi:hypothetical protein F0L74_25320 [Chitinophaga agrisoli]|uniref:Uncharacterized protein n=1 Tax=Chitinophaga agrisoli TaxID=2607653 RepID=A0A5B2VIX2_9BACT|nr:hypothetical protein [Chitinophaga agrisoli]KAA2239523.1 hypothetical protein F0L74_25320 [Chitinophaga agrisoli]
MLKSRIYQQVDNSLNQGTPGHLGRSGDAAAGGVISTVATIDNRELANADGVIQLSGSGRISNVDPEAATADDLVLVFGADRDLHHEFVLFDQVFTGDVSFRIDIQFVLAAGDTYTGISTVSFSTGEQITQPFNVFYTGRNNFTNIRFRNTKLSNSNVQTSVQMFNVLLFK